MWSPSLVKTSAWTVYLPCICCQNALSPTHRTATQKCSYRWDLLGQVDGFRDGDLALLDGTLEIHVLDLVAQIGLRVNQADVAVPDVQLHICALRDRLLHEARGLNEERCAAAQVEGEHQFSWPVPKHIFPLV
jgi:hypothetical protein